MHSYSLPPPGRQASGSQLYRPAHGNSLSSNAGPTGMRSPVGSQTFTTLPTSSSYQQNQGLGHTAASLGIPHHEVPSLSLNPMSISAANLSSSHGPVGHYQGRHGSASHGVRDPGPVGHYQARHGSASYGNVGRELGSAGHGPRLLSSNNSMRSSQRQLLQMQQQQQQGQLWRSNSSTDNKASGVFRPQSTHPGW